MHLEHLGESSVGGGHGWWNLSKARKRVSLGFNHPSRANGTDDLMPILVGSKLRCGAPMNWGTLWVLASSKVTVLNPNRMWSLKNEIGYFMFLNHHPITFNNSSISLMSFELWPSKYWPQNALRSPWRLLSTRWSWMMDHLYGGNKGLTRVHPPTWS